MEGSARASTHKLVEQHQIRYSPSQRVKKALILKNV